MGKTDSNSNSNIKTTWHEHIRSHPGMYTGMYIDKENEGSSPHDSIYILLKEVIDNAVNEFEKGYGKNIDITIKDNVVCVRDYGRGIPFDEIVECVTKIIPGKGIGVKPTNALSDYFKVQSFRDGQTKEVLFYCGKLISEFPVESSDQQSGTFISFVLDSSIFGNYQWVSQHLIKMMWNYAYLNEGLTINYNGQEFLSKNGLYDLLCYKMKREEMLYEPIHLRDDRFEFVFTHTTRHCGEELYSFVNKQYTCHGGTHQNAFREALADTIRTYFGKWYETDDICNALSAVISIKVQEPVFETGAHTRLGSDWMQPEEQTIRDYVHDVVGRLLGNHLHQHPDVGDIILNRINESEETCEELPL